VCVGEPLPSSSSTSPWKHERPAVSPKQKEIETKREGGGISIRNRKRRHGARKVELAGN